MRPRVRDKNEEEAVEKSDGRALEEEKMRIRLKSRSL